MKILSILKITAVVTLIIAVIISAISIKHLKESKNNALETIKAYDSILDSTNTSNRTLKLSVDQLHYFNDSIIKKMMRVKEELMIKDKELERMQYIASQFSKTDTLFLKNTDTIFVKNVNIDTLIGDKWFNMRLILQYPNHIIYTPTFNSEKYIISSTQKETINPPKKFFLARWFQKRHIVLITTVVEKNPYSEQKEERFIDIINKY